MVTQICSPSNACVCVECGVWTHVCIHKARFPSSHLAQLFCIHCTLVWLFCHETYLSSDPILALASMDSPDLCGVWTHMCMHEVHFPSSCLPGFNRIRSFVVTYWVRRYLDSTKSKVLFILKRRWSLSAEVNKNISLVMLSTRITPSFRVRVCFRAILLCLIF